MTRPVFPYPVEAVYAGKGDTNKESSFKPKWNWFYKLYLLNSIRYFKLAPCRYLVWWSIRESVWYNLAVVWLGDWITANNQVYAICLHPFCLMPDEGEKWFQQSPPTLKNSSNKKHFERIDSKDGKHYFVLKVANSKIYWQMPDVHHQRIDGKRYSIR